MKNLYKSLKISLFIVSISYLPHSLIAQESIPIIHKDSIISSAKQMMASTPYCALITIDTTGHPDA